MTFSGASFFKSLPAVVLFSVSLYSCNLIPGNFSGDAEDLISFLSDTLGIDSCLSGTQITEADLPVNAQSYLQSTYPQDSIDEVYFYEVGSDTTYHTYLASGTIVLFDAQGSLVAEGNPDVLDDDDLDDFVSDFLKQQYPGIDLDEVDDFEIYTLPGGGYLLAAEIDDNELLVEVDGSSICYELSLDDDGDDDDDYDDFCFSKDSLSASVDSLLAADYNGYEIEEIICDSLCDGTQGYWIEIDDEQGSDEEDLFLFFDENDQLLIESVEMDLEDVPSVVVDAAKQAYQEIDGDDVMKWTLASGAVEYVFSVEDSDDEFLASFDDTGAFICEWVSVDED